VLGLPDAGCIVVIVDILLSSHASSELPELNTILGDDALLVQAFRNQVT